MRIMDVFQHSETFSKAYYRRNEDEIVILMSQYLEDNEDSYLSESVEETYQSLPSTEHVEYYHLVFGKGLKSLLEKWSEEFDIEAEEYGYPEYKALIPNNKEQYSQLSDEQLFKIIVDFVAEVASVDWETVDFSTVFNYKN